MKHRSLDSVKCEVTLSFISQKHNMFVMLRNIFILDCIIATFQMKKSKFLADNCTPIQIRKMQ